MAINYQPTQWNNEQDPPISADNLNHIEQGIKATADRVDELVTVEANPSETPTATMESLEVDGTIYKVGGGHAVKDSSGNTMTQRENLQFTDAHTSDDSQGNTTKVEIAKQVTSQEWEDATEQGFYLIGDDDDYLLDISQVANADAEHLPYSSTKSTKQAIDEVNNNIPQLLQAQFALPSSVTIPVSSTVVVLNHFDITNSSIQDGLHDGKTLAQLLGGKTILGFVFLYSNGSACCGVDAIVWEGENTISLAIKNVSSASADVWAIRALIFYK